MKILEEFVSFFKKNYLPSNAVLSIAGAIDPVQTKILIAKYFSEIPSGPLVVQPEITLTPISSQLTDTIYDANIQIPAILAGYRVPGLKAREARALNMVSAILSAGAGARLNKKIVDQKKIATQVAAVNYALGHYGVFLTYAIPNGKIPLTALLADTVVV